MKRLLLPLLLALLGTGAGIGAGVALNPDPGKKTPQDNGTGPPAKGAGATPADGPDRAAGKHDYVELNNQFIVPVIHEDRVGSLVILSLSFEIADGQREAVYALEPKLRDVLLQVMFDHANMGGFDGTFTDGNTLDVLRQSLTEAARDVVGRQVSEVLIVDLARQDI
jgi:hypothetical protein